MYPNGKNIVYKLGFLTGIGSWIPTQKLYFQSAQ